MVRPFALRSSLSRCRLALYEGRERGRHSIMAAYASFPSSPCFGRSYGAGQGHVQSQVQATFLRVRKSIVDCCAAGNIISSNIGLGDLGESFEHGHATSMTNNAKMYSHPSEIPPLKLRRRAHLIWEQGGPKRVLVVKKHRSKEASKMLWEMALWLHEWGIEVLVEEKVQQREFPSLIPFRKARHECQSVDLCVSLGGDGTFLHMASLFWSDEPLPPSVSFAMGTLGFLTPFDVVDFKSTLSRVLSADLIDPVFCTLRTRKTCKVYSPQGKLESVHHVLNECLIDRGALPTLIKLECFVDGEHITTVQADGLIIATPSGSTAYSLSVGGPMVAPSVPCSLLTPIAPHSLSFRPLVVPESSDIVIHVPTYPGKGARASFDGRSPMELRPGSSIQCSTSECPMPVVNMGKLDHDWYEGITQKLKWNDPIIPGPGDEVPKMPVLGGPEAMDSSDDESW